MKKQNQTIGRSNRARYLVLMALGIVAFAASTAQAQRRDRPDRWDNFGCAEIGRRADLDVINVGRREGPYKAIRLEVSGNDVHIEDLRVVYGNGDPDKVAVREMMPEGTQSRAIDLVGRQRRIDRIELVSRRGFQGRGRGRARVCISGLRGHRRGGDRRAGIETRRDERGAIRTASWEPLGCQKVGFLKDRDAIAVDPRERRFKAIRLDVSGNDIRLDDLIVIYGNGEPDRVTVGQTIREGTVAGPFDLKGWKRKISRIEMAYRTKPNFRGSARVCVSGLQ